MKDEDEKVAEERIRVAFERYEKYAHAMQSGVKFEMGVDGQSTSPKHLRTGVNAAMVHHHALVELLMKKGVITMVEYYEEQANSMQKEAERYEAHLSKLFGKKVTLL